MRTTGSNAARKLKWTTPARIRGQRGPFPLRVFLCEQRLLCQKHRLLRRKPRQALVSARRPSRRATFKAVMISILMSNHKQRIFKVVVIETYFTGISSSSRPLTCAHPVMPGVSF